MPPSERSKVAALLGGSAGVVAAGRGSVAIAEELGLDVVLGDGGAVELDEDAVAPEAFGVHGARDELLAGAALAEDEYASVGRGHELDLLAQRLHGDAGAGNGALGGELPLELGVILAHLAGLHRVLEHDEGSRQAERLLEEVVGPEFRRAHCGFDGSVARDDDHLGHVGRVHLANLAQGVEAIAIGQPDIEQHDVVGGIAQQGQRLARGGRGGDDVTFFFENALERLADLSLVVDD